MYRIIALVGIVLAGCMSPEVALAQTEACDNRADSLFNSGAINRVKRGEMYRDCARSAYGQDPYREEYWAYYIYLASEVDAGRVTREQGNYLLKQKENELLGKRNAQIMQVLPYAIQQQQPLPSCSSFPPGLAGYNRAAGKCY